MIRKIDRNKAISRYPLLPQRFYNSKTEEFDFKFAKTFGSYVLTVPSKSYRGQIRNVGVQIQTLMKSMGYEKLIFMGDLDLPWRYRDHDYKPAKRGLDFLVENNVGKRFSGAFEIDRNQLPTFVIHLGWMVRCNAVIPYIYFVDEEQNLLGTICQYGNLHISTVSNQTDQNFKAKLKEGKFQYLIGQGCR